MKRLALILAGLGLLGLAVSPLPASADVNNFTITNFTADETLSRGDSQGELRIVEHINVNFTDLNHGILRALPNRYKNHSLQLHINRVSSDSGAASQYTTYSSGANTVLKIGSPDRTVTGSQEYTIDYTLRNVISFYKDHDELYWDVNGDQWSQTFEQVSVTVHVPSGLNLTQSPLCYSGSYGSNAQNCTVTNAADGFSSTTTQALSASQTLTYVAAFDKGYFQPSAWYQTLAEQAIPILKFAVPFLVLSIANTQPGTRGHRTRYQSFFAFLRVTESLIYWTGR